jgi:hypothetical protein
MGTTKLNRVANDFTSAFIVPLTIEAMLRGRRVKNGSIDAGDGRE